MQDIATDHEFSGMVEEVGWWDSNNTFCENGLLFHSSYEWLMPVIDKIRQWRHDNPTPDQVKEKEIVIMRFEIGITHVFIEVVQRVENAWDFSTIYCPFKEVEGLKEPLWETAVWFAGKINERKKKNEKILRI